MPNQTHRPVTRALARRLNESSKPNDPGSTNPTSSTIFSIPTLPLISQDGAEKRSNSTPTHTDTVILPVNDKADDVLHWRREYIEEHGESIELRTWTAEELEALEMRDTARDVERRDVIKGVSGEEQSAVKSQASLGQKLSSQPSSTSMYEVGIPIPICLVPVKTSDWGLLGKKGDSKFDVYYHSQDLPIVPSYHQGGKNYDFGKRVLADCEKAEEESGLAERKKNQSRGF